MVPGRPVGEFGLDGQNHLVQGREVPIVQAAPTREFPNPFDGI